MPRREIAKGAEPVASSDEEPSDDDSDSDASEEESMQAPLPAVRPSKAIEAVQYDTIKTLWRVPYRSATGDDIRKGLADFWDIVRTIRDRWKSDTLAVKAAEEAKKTGELPLLNERVSNQREMLEVALTAAISQGHKDIVEQYVFPFQRFFSVDLLCTSSWFACGVMWTWSKLFTSQSTLMESAYMSLAFSARASILATMAYITICCIA